MYIILLIHDDGDVTAVVDFNGSIKLFYSKGAAKHFVKMHMVVSAQKSLIVRIK